MSSEAITALILVAFLTAMVITLILMHHRYPGCIGIVFAGGLGYFFTQVMLEIPLLPLTESNRDPTAMLILLGVFSAFAVSAARYLIVRWTLSDRLSWGGALSAGIGHGFCEALFLFVFFYIIQLLVLPIGDSSEGIIADFLLERANGYVLLDGMAQIASVGFHIAVYLMLVNGFLKQQAMKSFAAICVLQLLYTFYRCYFFAANQNIWMYAAAVLFIAALTCIYLFQTYHKMAEFNQLEIGKDEAETALEEGY